MPIDLDFQAAPVTQFAKPDPATEGGKILGLGNAAISGVKQFEAAHNRRLQLLDEREMRQAIQAVEDAETQNAAEYEHRFFYGAEDLEGTTFKGRKYESNVEGETVSREIPAYEALPYIKRRNSEKALNNAAQSISNYTLRQKFLSKGRKSIEDQFQQDLINSEIESVEYNRFEIVSQVDEYLRIGKHEAAIALIENNSVFSDKEKSEMIKKTEKASEFYTVRSLTVKPEWDAGDIATAKDLIEYLGDEGDKGGPGYGGPLSLEERIKLINELQSRLAQLEERKKSQRQKENLAFKMELWERLTNQEVIPNSYFLEAEEMGLISASTAFTFQKKSLDNYQELDQKNKKIADLIATRASGGSIQRTAENRKLIDESFQAEWEQMLESNPEWMENSEQAFGPYLDLAIKTARTTGIIPDSAIQRIQAANRNNAEQLQLAAISYNALLNAAPNSMDDFAIKETDVIKNVAAGLRAGMDLAAATDAAIKVSTADEQTIERNQEIFNDLKKTKGFWGPNKLEAKLVELMNTDLHFQVPFTFGFGAEAPFNKGRFITDTGLPRDMVIDYRSNLERQMYLTDNVQVAEQKAYELIKSQWSITNINSPSPAPGSKERVLYTTNKWVTGSRGYEFMQFAPTVGMTEEGIVRLRNDIEYKFEEDLKPGEKLRLVSDSVTKANAEGGETLSYAIYAETENSSRQLGRWMPIKEEIDANWLKTAKKYKELEEERADEYVKQLEDQTAPQFYRMP